jgi:hypothetical protein
MRGMGAGSMSSMTTSASTNEGMFTRSISSFDVHWYEPPPMNVILGAMPASST